RHAFWGRQRWLRRSVGDFDRAAHDSRVAGERAEEGVVAACRQLVAGEGDAGALAAADHVGRGDHAGIAPGQVVGRTGLDAGLGHVVRVAGFSDDHVVAHRGHRQRTGVLELDGDGRAAGRYADALLVELHAVIALQGDGAVLGLGGANGTKEGESEDCKVTLHAIAPVELEMEWSWAGIRWQKLSPGRARNGLIWIS